MSDLETKNVQLLVNLLTFEKYWMIYVLSNGGLYEQELKQKADNLIMFIRRNFHSNSHDMDTDSLIRRNFNRKLRLFSICLNSWRKSQDVFSSIFSSGKILSNDSKIPIQETLFNLEEVLFKELGLLPDNNLNSSSYKTFNQNILKWSAQLPNDFVHKMDNNFIKRMSESDSIVMVADIRRSQDLMTYGSDSTIFQEYIMKFIAESRRILRDNCGLFDKFTGDGFIAYFNDAMCNEESKDYYEMMVKTCQEIMKFSNPFFEEWSSTLRKLPEVEIGLSIGVDSGKIAYKMMENQLIAIGDACVWATRMCSAGNKGEVIMNNIPFNRLRSSIRKKSYKEFSDTTKSGESFRAYNVDITAINYKINQDDLEISLLPHVIS